MGEPRRCGWCAKSRRSFSKWEQQTLGGEWRQLCSPCARRRLDNPYNALLRMRKIGAPDA